MITMMDKRLETMKMAGVMVANYKPDPKNILIFDIKGAMAHFRKYYTNSSSLSYLFPPKTVIIGTIAGLLGIPSELYSKKEDERYYDIFDERHCLVAIPLRSEIRRIMQTVNFLNTKKNPQSSVTQVPLELLVPGKSCEIKYRIYFYHSDSSLYRELKKRLERKRFVFPPYLGLTECLASIDYIDEGQVSKNSNKEVEINTVCKLKDIELELCDNAEFQYIAERMPTGFSNNRIPKKTEEYLVELKRGVIRIRLKDTAICYSINYCENGCVINENIMFM